VSSIYVIEDQWHDEPFGEYAVLTEAIAELERLRVVPWDAPPNKAPCQNWQNCGRLFEIIEYDTSDQSRKEVRRIPALEVSRTAVQWLEQLPGVRNDA
jgi:hypothetical protein